MDNEKENTKWQWSRVETSGCIRNLSNKLVNGISRMVERLEKVIRTPFNDFLHMVEFPSSFIFSTVLDYTPAEHGHGKGFREVELDGISGVIKTTRKIFKSGGCIIAILKT